MTKTSVLVLNKLQRKPTPEPLQVSQNYGVPFTFVAGLNKFTRDYGWRPKEIKGFDPIPPAMVVHDIMEHFPGDARGVHNEYQALGAMFWLRFEGGYFQDIRPPSETMVETAFGMLFRHIQHGGLTTKACPVVKESHAPLHETNTEYEILRTLANCSNYVKGSIRGGTNRDRVFRSLDHALGSTVANTHPT